MCNGRTKMPTRTKTVLAAALLTILVGSCVTGGRGRGKEEPKTVAELLAGMPAQTLEDRDALGAAFVRLGAPAVVEVCGMVAPMGVGDDVAARFALNGLAKYVSRPGAESERRMFTDAVVSALPKAAETESKAFLIRQLQVAGGNESVRALAAFLTDPALCEPATQALTAIATPKAVDALARASTSAVDANRVTIIKALAELRHAPSLTRFEGCAGSDDADLQQVALFGLANLGEPSSESVLVSATQTENAYERAKATSYLLLYARRLAEDGHDGQALSVCVALIQERTGEPSVQTAALSTLVEIGHETALDALLDAMDSDNKQLRVGALKLAARIPGSAATVRWAEKSLEAPTPVRLEILEMLGRRGDEAAAETVLAALEDEDESVRVVAVNALAGILGPEAAPAILAWLKQVNGDAEISAAKSVLLRITTIEVQQQIAQAVPGVTPEAQVILLEVLAARHAGKHADAVFAQTAATNPAVRLAAIKALETTASPKQAPKIVDLILVAETDDLRSAAQSAVVAVGKRAEDPDSRADALLAALETAPAAQKAHLLAPLPSLGGDKALARVVAETKNTDAGVRDAAIRALADWPEIAAGDALLDLAGSADELTHRVLAFRGYVRLVGASGLPAAEKVALYKTGLETAARPDEKKLILSGLGAVRSVESLELVGACLSDEALRAEAVSAAVRIACPKDEKDKGLTDPAIAPVLKKVAGATDDADVRKKIADHLVKVTGVDTEGFTTLFNGKDLTGWVGDTQGYLAEDGVLKCQPGGNLYTAKEYADFVFRFEFKLTPGGNNGLGVRMPIGGGAYNGMELQILDNTADKYKDLQPYQYHGSIYGIVPAKRGHLKPVGEWNSQEVIAKGRQITVILNGTTIVDADLDKASTPKTMDDKEHKGLDRAQGHLGFLGHGDVIEFRNIRIKELE